MRRSRSRADENVGLPSVESLELKPAQPVRRPGDAGDDVGAAGRGQVSSLFAAVGRLELTLDLLERRLERVEEALGAKIFKVGEVPAAASKP